MEEKKEKVTFTLVEVMVMLVVTCILFSVAGYMGSEVRLTRAGLNTQKITQRIIGPCVESLAMTEEKKKVGKL